ncbi:MAG TPA: DUF167 domain-containing protein [Acidimicrobiales bacterium]|jgi:hypothetical protein|nr:DUF167 domain-containing protein [Acidimicrobiales bacterium]
MQSALYSVNDDGSVELHVHAQPGAGRTQITGRHGDALKIRVAVPPEHGRANEALTTVIADAFGVSAGSVSIVSGEKSRTKRFRVAVDDVAAFADRLDELVAAGASGPGPADRDRWRPPRG